MAEGFITNQDKLSFREIVLSHLKKILELSTHEFRGGFYNATRTAVGTHQEYVPDARKCFIQAIENFAIILYPHFDEQMEKDYTHYQERIKKIQDEIPTLIDSEERNYRRSGDKAVDIKWNIVENRLNEVHILFTELNKLLKRTDYLKTAIYAEGMEEDEE